MYCGVQFAVVECSTTVRTPNLAYHGIPTPTLHDVFRTTIVAKILCSRLVWILLGSGSNSSQILFYPDVNVLVLLTIIYHQLNYYLMMRTILFFLRVLIYLRPVQTARVDASNQTNVKDRKHSQRRASTNLHKSNELCQFKLYIGYWTSNNNKWPKCSCQTPPDNTCANVVINNAITRRASTRAV